MATRNAINVLIKLLGGAEMTAELKQLGTTGEAAIKKIETSAKGISLANLGNAVNAFGKDLATVAERTALAFAGVAAAVAAAAPVVLLLAESGANAAQEAGNAAQAAGLQADAYQRLAFAASEANVSQSQFNTALASFDKQIIRTANETTKAGQAGAQAGRDIQQGLGFTIESFKDLNVEVTRFGDNATKTGTKAQTGAKKITTGFDDLGIKVKNVNGTLKTNDQLLLEVANAFQKLPDGASKSAIAVKLFGIEGTKLIPFLDEGAKGIVELGNKAADLGLIFSDDQIKAANDFDNALTEMKKTAGGLTKQIGLLFAPALTAGFNAFRDVVVRNRATILDFVKNGVQVATVFIKEFFAALSGRDADVTDNKWLITWRDNIVGFGKDVVQVINGVVIPAFQTLRKAAGLVTDAINKVFGTNLSGGQLLILAALTQIVGGFGLLRSTIMLAVEAIAFFSSALVANPWLIPIAAVAAGLAVWATSTNQATAALQRHKEVVDEVDAAYQKAGGSLAKMTQEVRDRLSLETADALEKDTAAFNEALSNLVNKLPHFEGDLGNAAAQAMFAVAKSLQEGKISVEQFNSEITKIGAANIGNDVGKLASAWLDMSKDTTEASGHVGEMADKLAFVTGKMSDADFAAKQAARGIAGYGQAATAATANTQAVGAAVDQTATKVQNLDHQITVFRGGGPGGQLSKEVFDVVDGVAHRADQSKAALDGVAASAATAASNVKNVSSEVTNSIAAVPAAIDPNAASSAVDGIVTDVNKLAPAAQEAAGGINSALGTIDAGSAEQAATAVVTPFESLPGKISTIMSGLQGLIQGGFSSLSSIVTSLAAQINSQIASILSALREAAAAAANLRAQAASSSSSSGGGSQGGFAEGGHLATGRGTSTSDSIPIWASLGEFITKAKAVAYYGPGLFHALNSMALPKDFLRGFSMGGMLEDFNRSMSIPRMATGGMVPIPAGRGGSSGRPLFLQLPDGNTARGTIEESAVSQLQRFAIQAGLLSTGRKPRRGK